mmetsp:Transcript_127550/g.232205  ORF Transcript_127550/g.232205 Transcript_127550/m.232205 type:complete len:404 (+) Transcript_127550:1-1212(+)
MAGGKKVIQEAPDIKKVKAAASAKSKNRSARTSNMQYVLWVGGSFGIIVVAVVMLIINPDRGPFQIPVNDGNLIAHINANAKLWRAGASSFFEGWTIGDAKMLEGVSVSQMGGGIQPCHVPEVAIPESFDARQKWPHCFNSPIYNMGNCTASWAIATASALSNRFCVANPEQYSELMLSPQQLLSCDHMQRGCDGGDIDTAWNFIEREGLVSEICFPYQADGTVSCTSSCSTEAPLKASSHCVLQSLTAIQREIFMNGPVVAPLFLVDDFLVYRGGLYTEMPTATQLSDARRQRIIHAVKIIGWGSMEGKPYWLIENSWGEDWGEHGYARVIAGGDPDKREGIMIESYVLAGIPSNKKVEDGMSDMDFEGDIDTDLEDIDVDLDDDSGRPGAKDDDLVLEEEP